jgi:hypothetical protein
MSITITMSKQQAKDLWEALDHLGLDMQSRLPDVETTDPDDMDIAEQCKRTYDISQHVMALIDEENTLPQLDSHDDGPIDGYDY